VDNNDGRGISAQQWGRIAVLLAAILWGTTGTAQALGPPHLSSVVVGFGRIVLGSIALAAVAARVDAGGIRRAISLGPRQVVLAALATAVYQAAFFSAVAFTGVAVGTAVALGSAPVFTGVLARIAFGERPERRWALATCTAVAGVLLVLAPWSSASAANVTGISLALASGFTYGVYTVSAKRLLSLGAPTLGMLVVTLGGGALLLSPAVIALGLAGSLRLAPLVSASGLAMLGWLGLATMAGAYLLYAAGLRRVPASTVGSLALGEPLTASILGLLILGERPELATLLGAALLLAGLVLLAVPFPPIRSRAFWPPGQRADQSERPRRAAR
jgi:DME family drug/metabolite transporter